ncbi:hypothetical protein COL922a_002637 [Colletotrichum nupharicola]|nr:hypothetical protein COL922a_002637 [Colletotrichum nupharicola]
MTEPNRGWSCGDAEMEKRWASTLSNYNTVRQYNGKFQLLLHDLWGTDFTDESMEWPGDNGDWTDFDRFLDTIISRIIDNDMISELYIDIWNEPEWGFWKRPQGQWLDMFGRTTNRFRMVTFSNMRSAAGAPEKPININEYLNLADELNPAATVKMDLIPVISWPVSYGATTKNLPYHPNGDWQALKYYNLNMTGYRAGTAGSEDRIFDVYATVGNDKVRALAGVRVKTGTWALTFKNLSAVGLPPTGELKIQTWGFTYEIPEAELDAPTDRGIATHSYTNDEITIAIYQTEEDWKTAWAFEFLV